MQRLMLEELTATLALEDVAHNYLDRMAILKNHCRCGDLSLHWRAVNAYEPFFGGWHFGAHDLKLTDTPQNTFARVSVDSIQDGGAKQLVGTCGSEEGHGGHVRIDNQSPDMHEDRIRRKLDQAAIARLALLQGDEACLKLGYPRPYLVTGHTRLSTLSIRVHSATWH